MGDDGELPEPTRLTSTDRSWSDPSWSPDGDRIAALTYDTQDAALFGDVAVRRRGDRRAHRPHGGPRPHLRALPRRPPAGLGRRRPAVLRGGPRRRARVPRYPSPAAAPTVVVGGDRAIEQFDAVDGTIACSASTPTRVAEVFVRSSDGDERAISDVGATFHTAVPALPAEPFAVPCADGAGTIDAWIVAPPGVDLSDRSTPVPALLSVHGGPMTQYSLHWFDEFQLWASAGFAVVYCNPRGSTGPDRRLGPGHPLAAGQGAARAAAGAASTTRT